MKIFYVLILFLQIYFMNSVIRISLVTPYVYNENSKTLLIKNNLPFEIFTTNNSNLYDFYLLNIDYNNSDLYISKARKSSIEIEADYILFVETYTIGEVIYIVVRLKTINNLLVYQNLFDLNYDIRINEYISNVSNIILNDLNNIKISKQVLEEKKKEPKNETKDIVNSATELIFNYKKYYKHEIFIQNGFFRNNPYILSFLNFYLGYSYYFSDNLNFSLGFMGGFGKYTKDLLAFDYEMSDKYVGFFTSAYFYVKGTLEPNIGVRVELNYDSLNNLYLSVPFDIGIKININKNNIIRFNSSFPFNSYDIFNNKWNKEFNLGFIIGYGFKI